MPAARAALAGGATWLAVVAAQEAAALRAAGIHAPILVMGALSPHELDVALEADADVVAWDEAFVAAVAARGGGRVHVKLDTGMGRLGTRDAAAATRVAQAAAATDGVFLAGAMTHFATADERGDAFFGEQLARFEAWALPLKAAHPSIILHAANSAATLRDRGPRTSTWCAPASRSTAWTRSSRMPRRATWSPRWSCTPTSSAVKPIARGESAGYGRRFVAARADAHGDGPDRVRRRRAPRADEQRRRARARRAPAARRHRQHGQRHPRRRQPAGGRRSGDAVVLIGRQGEERISAEELAGRLGTINYEVTCGLLPRVPRVYHRDGEPV